MGAGARGLSDPGSADLARATSRPRRARSSSGTAILILPQRNPVVTAKASPRSDHLAGGRRVLLGIGVGWLAEEFATLGVPFEDRGPRTDEYVAAMRALWSQERASFSGRFVSFRDDVLPAAATPAAGFRSSWAATRGAAARRARTCWATCYFRARGASDELLDEMRRAARREHGRNPDDIEDHGLGADRARRDRSTRPARREARGRCRSTRPPGSRPQVADTRRRAAVRQDHDRALPTTGEHERAMTTTLDLDDLRRTSGAARPRPT